MQKIHSTSNSIIGLLDNIDISQIKPFKYSYRRNISEDLHELCYSIKEKGLLHPIIVRMTEDGGYEIVAGTRRYNACKMLGWRKIFCQVVELEDKDAFEVSLIENIHSKNLNPIEEDSCISRLCHKLWMGRNIGISCQNGKKYQLCRQTHKIA